MNMEPGFVYRSSAGSDAALRLHCPRALQQLVAEAAAWLLAEALELEVRHFLQANAALKQADGSQTLVRNGYLPPRLLRTSVGDIRVQVPRTRDRSNQGLLYQSALIPPYHTLARLDLRIPERYLLSCLERDPLGFLEVLLGEHVAGLPQPLLQELRQLWQEAWRRQAEGSLATVVPVCWWLEQLPALPQSLLYLVALQEDGRHALLFVVPESAGQQPDWKGLLLGLRRRGLRRAAQLVHTRDPGFLQAVAELFPEAPAGY
jgi:putative transposase